MTSLLTGLLRGTAAGAAGTTALNLTTQADMALRARPASGAPTELVSAVADRVDVDVPGSRRERGRRLEGLGGLAGSATGVAVGGLAGVLRSAGVRLPAVVGGPLLGLAAMAASDLPMARLGLTDPRRWANADWAADAVPHLVYGVTTHATLSSTFRADDRERAERPHAGPRPATTGSVLRAAALDAATGARSTAGPAALAWRAQRGDRGASGTAANGSVRTLVSVLALGEVAGDMHPAIPPRTSPSALVPRLALAAGSASTAARRDGREPGPGALVAAGTALGAAVGGMRLRGWAQQRLGTDLPGALAEDALTAVLGWVGAGRSA
ncbi:hypothetical protein GCM10023200_21380 [Actinomycetospora chlora]|uniref:Uncharacterized protein n=1 Tax=Actinomycetospora chlora TaxID=663608 RepID=A0ABP9AVX2_9PSEU